MATVPVARATVTALQLGTPIAFHGWNGWIPSMQAVIDRYVRQGATGSGAEQTGILGNQVKITAWRIEDAATTAVNNIATWESFEGLVCSVIDPWARNLPRVRFTECAGAVPRVGKGPLAESGSQGTHLVVYSAVAERLSDTSS